MTRSILMVTILLANVGFSQDRVLQDKVQKSQSDTEGRIYEVLADFKVSFDDYRSRPHAFLATGVRRNLRESTGFVESRVLWIAARMDKQRYDANAFFQPGGIVPKWYQRISTHGKALYRTTSPTAAPLDPSGDPEFDEAEFLLRQQIIIVQPFSATISPATVFRNSQRFGEDHWHRFFLKAEFVKGEYDDDGNLVGHWRNTENAKSGNRTYATLLFSRDQNWLPQTTTFSIERKHAEGRIPVSVVHTKWTKTGDAYLPGEIDARLFHPGQAETQWKLTFSWKTGQQLPDGLINEKLEDWRTPLAKLFGVKWFAAQ